jgi:hypothetical protein
MPASTCQNKALNGKEITMPKLIFMTNKIPSIPEIKKVISSKKFQIFL